MLFRSDGCRVKCEVLAVSVISRQWLLFAPFTVIDVYKRQVVIIKGNGAGRRVTVNMNSELTQWLEENLEKNDLLLDVYKRQELRKWKNVVWWTETESIYHWMW